MIFNEIMCEFLNDFLNQYANKIFQILDSLKNDLLQSYKRENYLTTRDGLQQSNLVKIDIYFLYFKFFSNFILIKRSIF